MFYIKYKYYYFILITFDIVLIISRNVMVIVRSSLTYPGTAKKL